MDDQTMDALADKIATRVVAKMSGDEYEGPQPLAPATSEAVDTSVAAAAAVDTSPPASSGNPAADAAKSESEQIAQANEQLFAELHRDADEADRSRRRGQGGAAVFDPRTGRTVFAGEQTGGADEPAQPAPTPEEYNQA